MKKILLLFILVLTLLPVAGCGNPVKSDLEAYIKFEQGCNAEIQLAVHDFMSKANRPALSNPEKIAMLNESLQKFAALTEKQKAYKPKTSEVQAVHNKALQQLDLTIQVFQDVIQAVQTDTLDEAKAEEFTKRQQEAQNLAEEYYNDIIRLREKNK